MNQDQDGDVRRRAMEAQPSSAARLLEMTARETDQWRSDAQAEASAIVATARDDGDALLQAARDNARAMIEAARLEAARTLDEARTTAEELRNKTESERQQAELEVANLRDVASDHAQQLWRHLQDMLDRLESVAASPGRPASEDA